MGLMRGLQAVVVVETVVAVMRMEAVVVVEAVVVAGAVAVEAVVGVIRARVLSELMGLYGDGAGDGDDAQA